MANKKFRTTSLKRIPRVCKRVGKGSQNSKPNFRGRNKIKKIGRAIDKFAECTRYGFVYDNRKIKREWLR